MFELIDKYVECYEVHFGIAASSTFGVTYEHTQVLWPIIFGLGSIQVDLSQIMLFAVVSAKLLRRR